MKRFSLLNAILAGVSLTAVVLAQNPVKFDVPGATDNKTAPAANANKAAPATAPAQTPAKPAASAPATATPAPAAPEIKFTEAQLLETYGWILARQMRFGDLEFTADQMRAVTTGMQNSAAGKEAPANADQMGQQLQELLGGKQAKFLTKVRNQNLSDQLAFFIKLKENKNVIEQPSGLRYEVLKAGTGAQPKAGQVAKIHYKLSGLNGQVVEDSNARGQPIDLLLQEGYSIAGMIEGLQLTKTGGKTKLYVPAHLAYGDEGNQGIPPGATLIFEVELLEVKDAPKPEAAEAKK
jgi:FKBP-type peptidyl-prolyl cis-trans isomerase